MLTKVIEPSYLYKFSCIGSDCEDTCCSGWKIIVDQESYKKYQKSSIKEEKELLTSLKKNTKNPSNEYYAEIVLNDDSCCPNASERFKKVRLK